MKDTIKNSIIGAFALFGLLAIISGTTTQPTTHETTFGTPESHVWEFALSGNRAYNINKVTGEVRKHNAIMEAKNNSDYVVMKEKKN